MNDAKTWDVVEVAFEYHPQKNLTVGQIASVEAEWTDGSDEPQYVWLFKLDDGRFAVGRGWCDYTGWDCQSNLQTSAHATREEAIRFGLTLNERELLNLSLPGEAIP